MDENPLRALNHDARLLFLARFLRLFAYGALSVVLVFFLTRLGLTESRTGLLFTSTLVGDTAISLYLTTAADRIGRRRMLVTGALLMAGAGLAFAFTRNFLYLVLAGTIGVVSPSGNEVGPFLPIEQAALSQIVHERSRTATFAWYALAGSVASAIGALCGGMIPAVVSGTLEALDGYRTVVILYACAGFLLALVFVRVSDAVEVNALKPDGARPTLKRTLSGVVQSRKVVVRLSGLFALDAFGGGFVIQSFAAYWFYLRFGVNPGTLGAIFFAANVFAGISALVASRLASRFGLVKTMVFTHLPSNILLIVVPLMPTLPLATSALLLRFSLSQMDVPTRQSYLMGVVFPEERSAAAGITGVARTTGASIAPWFAGMLFARPSMISAPFFLAGTLKIVYDLLLYHTFGGIRPPEEMI